LPRKRIQWSQFSAKIHSKGKSMRRAQLCTVELPDFGLPTTEPVLEPGLYENRIAELQRRIAAHKLDAIVIYGDREHVANISWATGYDPRFEEAILIVVPGRKSVLLLGNEGYPYAETANGIFERVLWQPLSLMGQPRDKYKPLAEILHAAGLTSGMKIGLAGWKGFETEDGEFDPDWFETPHFLVSALQKIGTVTNAALLFMHPTKGLRTINEVEQLARFEFASTLSSSAIRRALTSVKPGMTEYEFCGPLNVGAFPQSIHVNMCSGPVAKYGLPSPSTRVIQISDPIVVGMGLMGSLNCRAGFLVGDESQLPKAIQDYVAKLVVPYFTAAVAWYETLAIGVTGGELYDAVMHHIGDPFFGIGLNPGHLIHLDEWMHSPIKKNSKLKLASGMALQCDIIPATGTEYFTSNIEDGVALAGETMRKSFQAKYPEAWKRIEARRAFMIETLGIKLRPEVLPFSNMAGWLPPFWLAPEKAMAMRG
jgi:Creatinase/Prolidase N-terminal domain/Metallopeptidase family M24